jgi:acetyl/propionyl-CoA carboxylase alpha subunit/acetyl-CoA carboxylase carboxyltransferase component
MPISKLLVANRGEIAIRIMRAAAEQNISTVAIYSEDDTTSLHVSKADESVTLTGAGAPAYLDISQVIDAAKSSGCDAIHPGYGFLSENADFAQACADTGITFVGPTVETLKLFGDKAAARHAAQRANVPILPGSDGAVTLDEATRFFDAQDGAIIIKALVGGGGRGVRVVKSTDEIGDAYDRAKSEALASFGNDAVFVERYLSNARHIEVQILGNSKGGAIHLGERDCSIQRRHQKLVEIAPAPGLPDALRDRITGAAVALAKSVQYDNIGTVEFLVDAANLNADSVFYFIEANPRLQVEHTVTEEVFGVDLVQAQLHLAEGASLDSLGLSDATPRGFAIQCRVNMERIDANGAVLPTGGTLTAFEAPTGPGIRTDTFGYTGYATSSLYDSLLAKVITHRPGGDFSTTAHAAYRALCECRIEGVASNVEYLLNILQHPAFVSGALNTQFLDAHARDLLAASTHKFLHAKPTASDTATRAGVSVDSDNPLAVLVFGQSGGSGIQETSRDAGPIADNNTITPDGALAVRAPLQGTIVAVNFAAGDEIREGQTLLIMEAMKMEHEIRADISGVIQQVTAGVGDTVYDDHALAFIAPGDVDAGDAEAEEDIDPDYIRPDLREVLDRHATTKDANRPKAVARRETKNMRTARANVEDMFNMDTFLEYAPLVIAAQRQRHSVETLIEKSPTDGLITGLGAVNDHLFDDPDNRCAVMCYDYTVFAGTQGVQNHRKTDRILDVAEKTRVPFILFAEGGGGRPGDTDRTGGVGGQSTFSKFATLSGLVPMVGITAGRCFAGNASLLGCCDVIIATKGSNIGMGGPAMIEGGGLGVFAPEDIGPMDVQVPNGVVDILVEDEAEAVVVAKKYLSYFQGAIKDWEAPDQRIMRRIIPENRLRVYEIRDVINTIADIGSVLEIRSGFGIGIVTAFIRVEGRPVGVLANNPKHLGGAIDSDGADKGSRFMQLCDAHDIPILNFCDTPGIMVGPEVEKTALVRHANRMFVTGANLTVPFFTIILRKAYGLGAITMAGGAYKTAYFCVSWPTGEFGGMGLEGAVKLGYRDDLAAIEDPEERLAKYEEMVAKLYDIGKAVNQASYFGFDDAIDPADSRKWVINLLKSVHPAPKRDGKKRPAVDSW